MNCETDQKTETYYIASARCHETLYSNGKIACKEDTLVWLCMDMYGPACSVNKGWAHKFSSPIEIIDTWEHWDCFPWYHSLKPESLQIFKVHIATTIITSEERAAI